MNTAELTAEAIPFTAWEQAVFVVLFIVFVVALLGWFSKQSDKWQRFMFEIDEKWREFSRQQRQENNDAMTDVKEGLNNLASVTEGLVQEVKDMREDSRKFHSVTFENHDKQAKEILEAVKTKRTKEK